MTFETAIGFILKWEKAISNDPDDPGGLTKWGISSVAYPQVKDAAFSRFDAIAIYKSDFWERFRCGDMPNGVELMMFDAAVNQTQQAARLMQKAVNVPADGIIGPQTLDAIKATGNIEVITEMGARRAVAYASNTLVQRDGLGWFRRLADCISTASRAT